MSVLLLAISSIACNAEPFTLTASEPISYSSGLGPLDRVAILVTIANNSQDDLQVDPSLFLVRDNNHRIYPANAAATATDAYAVMNLLGIGSAPLPLTTLRKQDILTGFVLFDVPSGVKPVELIFRQADNDTIVSLAAAP